MSDVDSVESNLSCPGCGKVSETKREGHEGDMHCMNSACRVWIFTTG